MIEQPAAFQSSWRTRNRWAAHVAIFALVFQVLMPLTHAMAAPLSPMAGDTTRSIVQICTAFGIQTSTIADPADSTPAPAAALAWDCPLCLNQLGAVADTKPVAQVLGADFGPAFGRPGIIVAVAASQAPSPHFPRAPPA